MNAILLIPQSGCELTNALRDYEAAHQVYMNTSIFTDKAKAAKQRLAQAREKYVAAYQKAIVL